MQLDTQKGVFNVHIGPMWWTHVRDAAPNVGDPVTIVGFRVSFDKKPTIVAKEITINGKVFTVWEKADRAVSGKQ